MRSGDRHGLQNRREALSVSGVFDSHTLPPILDPLAPNTFLPARAGALTVISKPEYDCSGILGQERLSNMTRKIAQVALVLCLVLTASIAGAQTTAPFSSVKAVQVDPTIVPNPESVKESSAPNLVRDSLRNALRYANIEIAETAPVRAHIVLDEFTSGSTAKRVLVGMGAGRSSVTCHLVVQDADGKELANTKIHVRGNLAWSPYQGNNTQRKQAVSSFEQKLIEEIEKMK